MFPSRTTLAALPFACLALAVLTSCRSPRTIPPPGPGGEPEAPAAHPGGTGEAAHAPKSAPVAAPRADHVSPPTRPALPPAAASVVERLAAQLLVEPEAVVITAVEAAEWPDGCLGLPAEGEICSTALVPGFAVRVTVGIDAYEFRTDLTGDRVRLASGPPARAGDPLVTWRDSQSFNMMIVGTERVATGRRGRPLIASPLAVPARATELQTFLAHFAPFQAQTPAGEIALRGVGSARASVTEQRMIAEWARLVSLEARSGREQPEAEVALRWTRRGGPGGVCDTIEVLRTGTASARSCRGNNEVPIASVALTAEELAALYGWLDRLEGFDLATGVGTGPTAETTTVNFRGTGVDESTPAEQQAVLSWVDAVAVRLREAALHP